MSTEKADIYTLAKFGDLETFRKILKIEDINGKSGTGSGLLHYSISGGKFDIAMFLIENGIDVNQTNENGQTAVHYICKYPNMEVAKKILEYGGDINIRDKYGNNAVWTAVFNCKGRYYDMIELFMEHNPDTTTKNNTGKSPLDFAIQVGNNKLIELLNKN